MIVSHRHKFIFLAVPKTGTHSVRHALRPVLGPDDWEQVDLFEKKRLPVAELAAIEHGHISAHEAISCLGDELWSSYFTFAFVRNPLDRFVSLCFFLYAKNRAFRFNPTAFMKLLFQTPEKLEHLLFLPQCNFICDLSGELLIDKVYSFENLEADFNLFCHGLGLSCRLGSPKNQTVHAHYSVYIDDELEGLIRNYYLKDFAFFGY
jgi:hypothetical protein